MSEYLRRKLGLLHKIRIYSVSNFIQTKLDFKSEFCVNGSLDSDFFGFDVSLDEDCGLDLFAVDASLVAASGLDLFWAEACLDSDCGIDFVVTFDCRLELVWKLCVELLHTRILKVIHRCFDDVASKDR